MVSCHTCYYVFQIVLRGLNCLSNQCCPQELGLHHWKSYIVEHGFGNTVNFFSAFRIIRNAMPTTFCMCDHMNL